MLYDSDSSVLSYDFYMVFLSANLAKGNVLEAFARLHILYHSIDSKLLYGGKMKRRILVLLSFIILIGCAGGRYDDMRHGLDSINTINKNNQPLIVEDIRSYVNYFNHNGSSKDRLLAYYLLGRAYYERGESPMALKCYLQIIEQVDTASISCDFSQLSRVYGQMADIYYYQNLFDDQLHSLKYAILFAKRAKDTLNAIIYEEQMAKAYLQLRKYDSVISVTNEVSRKYQSTGYYKQAAISLSNSFPVFLQLDSLNSLFHNMLIYEKQSGLFDKYGNIAKGREVYYAYKGFFFLKSNYSDSSEYYFRKALREGKDWNCQNAGSRGLALLFQQKNIPDSAVKYSLYSYMANDSVNEQKAINAIKQMNALYNYTHYEKKARKEAERAKSNANLILFMFIIIILVVLLTYIVIYREKQKRKLAYDVYLHSIRELEDAKEDLAKLYQYKNDSTNLIEEKEQLIVELERTIQQYQETQGRKQPIRESLLFSTPIYKRFEYLSNIGGQPTDKDWHEIEKEMSKTLPNFWELISHNHYQLTLNEYNTCILIRLKLNLKGIGNMLNLSPSSISKMRINMLQKIFGICGKPRLFDERIQKLF